MGDHDAVQQVITMAWRAQTVREFGERAAAIQRAALRTILTTLDVDAPSVVIDAPVHPSVSRRRVLWPTLHAPQDPEPASRRRRARQEASTT